MTAPGRIPTPEEREQQRKRQRALRARRRADPSLGLRADALHLAAAARRLARRLQAHAEALHPTDAEVAIGVLAVIANEADVLADLFATNPQSTRSAT